MDTEAVAASRETGVVVFMPPKITGLLPGGNPDFCVI